MILPPHLVSDDKHKPDCVALHYDTVMMEKKTWKMELSQKMKEVESLQASAKRASSCRADITQKAEQYLSERNDLEVEVTDLVTQVLYSLIVEFVFCHRPAVTYAHSNITTIACCGFIPT